MRISDWSSDVCSSDLARVVASLVEKSITTPAYYPMTTNALMLAANQKTSRNPVLSLTEGEVGNALNRLEELKLIGRDSFSSRAQKWRQQFLHQKIGRASCRERVCQYV